MFPTAKTNLQIDIIYATGKQTDNIGRRLLAQVEGDRWQYALNQFCLSLAYFVEPSSFQEIADQWRFIHV
jgi:hypothetical protein